MVPKYKQLEFFKLPSRRRSGAGEYFDHLDRLRTHKGNISPQDVVKIKSRKLIGGTKIKIDPDYPGESPTPPFEIFVHNKKVGFIERGHRNIRPSEFRGLGVFREAMRQLEKYELDYFRHGHYQSYLHAIENEVSIRARKGAIEFIKSLEGKNHFDYTRLAPVAGKLMELGYELVPPDRKFVLEEMKQGNAKREELIAFLKSYSFEDVFELHFVLFKPVQIAKR